MRKFRCFGILAMIAVCAILVLFNSCKKENEETPSPVYLSVDLPKLTLQDKTYYEINCDDHAIELEFSEPVDSASLDGNISFYDKNGLLDTVYTMVALDRKILLIFDPQFDLKPGWQYNIKIGKNLKSVNGLSFESDHILDLRTFTLKLGSVNNSSGRNAILCISDIHLGEYRGIVEKYCWFSENDTALLKLLDNVLCAGEVRQVVILGDLFDGWVIPFRSPVFDASTGVTNIREYFHSVANSPVNQPVIEKLKTISSSGNIELIYVPGNHDMLLTEDILKEIIPGITWKGDATGLGHYNPVDEIIMEHGHRFDFFNSPQPLVNQGHMLPPGFFISRLQATASKEHPELMLKSAMSPNLADTFFVVAWTVAFEYLRLSYNLTVHEDSLNILMNGVDGYNSNFSYNSARDMYRSVIESLWNPTQAQNQVPVNIPVLMAILDGDLDMDFAATHEYMSDQAPKKYRISVMGHTHNPELKFYTPFLKHKGIYANSGSWVNQNLTKKNVRTYLMIWPGKWTNSDIDVVSLYHFDRSGKSHTRIDEKSISNK